MRSCIDGQRGVVGTARHAAAGGGAAAVRTAPEQLAERFGVRALQARRVDAGRRHDVLQRSPNVGAPADADPCRPAPLARRARPCPTRARLPVPLSSCPSTATARTTWRCRSTRRSWSRWARCTDSDEAPSRQNWQRRSSRRLRAAPPPPRRRFPSPRRSPSRQTSARSSRAAPSAASSRTGSSGQWQAPSATVLP